MLLVKGRTNIHGRSKNFLSLPSILIVSQPKIHFKITLSLYIGKEIHPELPQYPLRHHVQREITVMPHFSQHSRDGLDGLSLLASLEAWYFSTLASETLFIVSHEARQNPHGTPLSKVPREILDLITSHVENLQFDSSRKVYDQLFACLKDECNASSHFSEEVLQNYRSEFAEIRDHFVGESKQDRDERWQDFLWHVDGDSSAWKCAANRERLRTVLDHRNWPSWQPAFKFQASYGVSIEIVVLQDRPHLKPRLIGRIEDDPGRCSKKNEQLLHQLQDMKNLGQADEEIAILQKDHDADLEAKSIRKVEVAMAVLRLA